MIHKQLDQLGENDIDALIQNQVPESKTIDYKQALPGESDADKKEFLADVCSFANASGGDIIFGIKEATDPQGRHTGVPESVTPLAGVVADDAIRRLESIVRDGIAPRVRVQTIPISGWGEDRNGLVIVMRVHRSFSSPHMVTFKNTSRFYSRTSAGKHQLDVHEIRSAALATASQADRIKRFVQDRLSYIAADETPVSLKSPGRLVVHLIPIATFLNRDRLTFPDTMTLVGSFPPIPASGGWTHRFNLDGFLTHSGETRAGSSHSYCQLFFDGVIEAVFADLLRDSTGGADQARTQLIASVAFEKHVIQGIMVYLDGYRRLGLLPPIVVSVALLGCRGAYLAVKAGFFSGEQHPIDRAVAVMPVVTIEALDDSVPQLMRPVFDAVWNACGFERSQNYDGAGEWNPR